MPIIQTMGFSGSVGAVDLPKLPEPCFSHGYLALLGTIDLIGTT